MKEGAIQNDRMFRLKAIRTPLERRVAGTAARAVAVVLLSVVAMICAATVFTQTVFAATSPTAALSQEAATVSNQGAAQTATAPSSGKDAARRRRARAASSGRSHRHPDRPAGG